MDGRIGAMLLAIKYLIFDWLVRDPETPTNCQVKVQDDLPLMD